MNGKKVDTRIIVAIIAALALIAVPIVNRLLDLYFPPPTPTLTIESNRSFAGTWEGIDPFDGSIVTMYLVESGSQLVGTINDSFSGELQPPGYHGDGSGIILSSTTGHIKFTLSRWDGDTANWEIDIKLSNQDNTLTFTNCYFGDEPDPGGCPLLTQRK